MRYPMVEGVMLTEYMRRERGIFESWRVERRATVAVNMPDGSTRHVTGAVFSVSVCSDELARARVFVEDAADREALGLEMLP